MVAGSSFKGIETLKATKGICFAPDGQYLFFTGCESNSAIPQAEKRDWVHATLHF